VYFSACTVQPGSSSIMLREGGADQWPAMLPGSSDGGTSWFALYSVLFPYGLSFLLSLNFFVFINNRIDC